ncbi:hypothetical protein FRACYDRAFT_235260 [Fragilariopsis cylindrus CCMP1102]|uniref:Uncharacterized protein n=1 Tax=Fragilariopsis cylindrus CCMP1102 TaxID=635003 RepID=A0A1E7FU27_9STRA|nr:hypothetical protein FRACYDRAFT_235260 [Fragilariopsis cylindrus CCMP1102]|eukprot:OEU21634.1 hypothetical protein FRACYDRAFT_235260 [Fragilariopsis cylindrus CCMP1102]
MPEEQEQQLQQQDHQHNHNHNQLDQQESIIMMKEALEVVAKELQEQEQEQKMQINQDHVDGIMTKMEKEEDELQEELLQQVEHQEAVTTITIQEEEQASFFASVTPPPPPPPNKEEEETEQQSDHDHTLPKENEEEEEQDEKIQQQSLVVESASSTTTTTTTEEVEQADTIVRSLISNGLQQLTYTERCCIQDEIHGVQSMGCMDEETNPLFVRSALQQFNKHLDDMMMSSSTTTPHTDDSYYSSLFFRDHDEDDDDHQEDGTSSNTTNSTPALPPSSAAIPTYAYELCLRKNYIYAQKGKEEVEDEQQHQHLSSSSSSSSFSSSSSSSSSSSTLKLMCLRAELWNPQKACERFLRHLNTLYKYYGEDALQYPLTLQRFFHQNYQSQVNIMKNSNNNNNNNKNKNKDNNNRATTITETTSQPPPLPPPRKKRPYKKRGSNKTKGTKRVSTTPEGGAAADTTNDDLLSSSTNTPPIHHSMATPEMSWLKQGGFQLLPSRERSGRRVVIFHGISLEEQQSKLNNNNIHAMFKAMLYFFTTIAKCDIDAQRDGIVLILSASVASSFTSFSTTSNTSASSTTSSSSSSTPSASTFLDEYYNLHQSMPIRCSSVHICYDIENDRGLSSIRLDMIQRLGHVFSQRVRIYDKDASNFQTKNQLSTYGIHVHDIPLTGTSSLKFKHHFQWIKIQEFFEKQENLAQEAIAIAEAEEQTARDDSSPISLSYLQHSQGQDQQQLGLDISLDGLPSFFGGGVGVSSPCHQFQQQQLQHFWNENNKFQRGNLEFMEIIESKIPIYQDTRSWKKKHEILVDALSEFLDLTDGRGRFLTNATQLKGMISEKAPDGCWIDLPLNSPLLMQKVRNLLINHIRRLENRAASLKRKTPGTTKSSSSKNAMIITQTVKKMKTTTGTPQQCCAVIAKPLPMNAFTTLPPRTTGRRNLASVFDCATNNKNNSNGDVIDGDRSTRLHNVVDAIVAIDDRLNKEVDELFLLDDSLRTTTRDFGTTLMDSNGNDNEHDGIVNNNVNNGIANNEMTDVLLGCSA